MQQYTKEQLHAAFLKLTNEVQDAVLAETTNSKILEVYTTHSIPEDTQEQISVLATACMVGLMQHDSFKVELTQAGVTPESTTELLEIIHTVQATPAQVAASEAPGAEEAVAAQPTPPIGSTSPLEQFVKKDAEVQARFEKLPEGVRSEILSSAVAASFSTLVREHALEQEAFMTFGAHVLRVLTGLENVNDLRAALRDKKIVAHEEVEPFAQKVEAGMVKPVRDAIVAEVGKRKGKG